MSLGRITLEDVEESVSVSKGWHHLQPFKSTHLLLMEELLPTQGGGTGQDVLLLNWTFCFDGLVTLL